jgi:glutamine---fructose-6-phosphate transaminase (isomerizing)
LFFFLFVLTKDILNTENNKVFMCGIFGYVGKNQGSKACIQGLKLLEYRGYDSSGIAGIFEGELFFKKEAGKIVNLEQALGHQPLPLDIAIAHTRWATHGKPSQENAHPHFDQHRHIAVVHNGIIENYLSLREMLQSKGVVFSSDTDTEVIAQLVSYFYRGDLLEASMEAMRYLRGFWAIALIHKDHPGQIIASARENPLAIALSPLRNEAYLSSDANAFPLNDAQLLFLQNDEIALVSQENISVFDFQKMPIQRPLEKMETSTQIISKNGFEHFMIKEIFEQPQTIRQAMHNRFLWDLGMPDLEQPNLTAADLLSIQRVLILGCGTSWHAGLIAASLFEDMARIPAQAEIASEFCYKNPIITEDTLLIAISQSGETFDTLTAVKEAKAKGVKVLAICNVRNSSLTRIADATLFLRAGPEISVCSTKAFTSQITLLSLFVLWVSRLRHFSKEEGQLFLQELEKLPDQVEQILRNKDQIRQAAQRYASFEKFFFLGRHYMFPTCLEAALKLKEISYVQASGYPAGEMKHGPIALVAPDLVTIGLCGNEATLDRMFSNLNEIHSRSSPLVLFGPKDNQLLKQIADCYIELPPLSDRLAVIPYTVACQLFAYYIAYAKEKDIDHPRNLAKSVTVG